MNEEKLQFSAEISKILQLMIHSLYTNKAIFLRELISNASDACDKLRYEAVTHPDLTKEDSEFKVGIVIDKNARTVTISDNGIGMSRDELVRNLGTIAKSGTQEFMSALSSRERGGASRGEGPHDIHSPHPNPLPEGEGISSLIGQFGVGFYSSFMVADKVTVISTKAGTQESWKWESEGMGEFTVAPVDKVSRGTAVTLHLKPAEDEFLDKFRLRHIVQTYSDHISFPIALTDEEGNTETVNTAAALWMRSKSDITPEQYTEFYHHVAHAPDDPWLVLHNKAEGKLEYTNLLFIPSMKPFDLFHPDRKRRVKLYVKRVFITEENVDIVPHYLRFLRGIIDSEDLPLNISRETIQHNPLLQKIKDSVVKRVLSELKKKGEGINPVGRDSGSTGSSDPAQSLHDSQDVTGYNTFWKNFGAVLKEGLCEATSPREALLETCRFYSSAIEGEGLTSLDAYVSRMKEGQEYIYYLTGEHLDTLRMSPQLEGFAKRGIEVLLLADHVDDFWVNVVQDYKGKAFKSVTRADIELDKIKGDEKDERDEKNSSDNDAVKQLCERFKRILGDKVKDVRTTGKLTQSAVCLAVEEGAMDFRLERFLIEQKQIAAGAAKILEINPDHSIIRSLMAKIASPHPNPLPEGEGMSAFSHREKGGDSRDEGEAQEIEDVVWLLFDQARILEGEELTDPAAFTRRLQSFVEKSLAA